MRKALLSGITGQDGSYLAELLLAEGVEVHGIIRRSSSFNTGRIDHIFDRLHLHYGDLTDAASIGRTIAVVRPDEIYNLGGQSHVKVSFEQPEYTAATIVSGTLAVLEGARALGNDCRVYQASSSEMFGGSPHPLSETSPMRPRSPYAVAKLAAHEMARCYRESYGMFVACGILFNHESPRRGETFVTRKITRAATRIKLGLQQTLTLGNLSAMRDWGFAGDYTKAMRAMLRQDSPRDYVIGTGTSVSVAQFVAHVFHGLGLNDDAYVRIDERYMRPAEVDCLIADPAKASRDLDWKPTETVWSLADMMVEADMRLARREQVVAEHEGAVQ